MPPDAKILIRQLLPQNSVLSDAVIQVCNRVYKANNLPVPLVKMVVTRANELAKRQEMDPSSKAFLDKLAEYAKSIKPRFNSQITQLKK